MSDAEKIARSYDFCREMAQKSRSNFYAAFSFLSPEKKRSMEAIYAFMRHSDDLADSPEIPDAERLPRLDRWQADFLRMVKNHNSTLHSPLSTLCDRALAYGTCSDMILPAVIDTLHR